MNQHKFVRAGKSISEVNAEGLAMGGTIYGSINAAKRASRELKGTASVSPVRTAESLKAAA